VKVDGEDEIKRIERRGTLGENEEEAAVRDCSYVV